MGNCCTKSATVSPERDSHERPPRSRRRGRASRSFSFWRRSRNNSAEVQTTSYTCSTITERPQRFARWDRNFLPSFPKSSKVVPIAQVQDKFTEIVGHSSPERDVDVPGLELSKLLKDSLKDLSVDVSKSISELTENVDRSVSELDDSVERSLSEIFLVVESYDKSLAERSQNLFRPKEAADIRAGCSTVRDQSQIATDVVASTQLLTRSASDSFTKTKGLDVALRSALSLPCVSDAGVQISKEMAKIIDLSRSESLTKLSLFNVRSKEDCFLTTFVRPPRGDMSPKEITVRVTAKQVKDGKVKIRLLSAKTLAKPAGKHMGLDVETAKRKRKVHGVSPLVIEDIAKAGVKWLQKPGPRQDDVIVWRRPLDETACKKRHNARKAMGYDRLQRYEVIMQCRQMEIVKMDEDMFPGIMPPDVNERFKALMAAQSRTVN